MAADLDFSISALDWADSQLPSFKERMESWARLHLQIKVVNDQSHPTHNLLIAQLDAPFPLAFSVEFGALINVVRSSLDIMACAIAKRHGITQLDNVYFPVASSRDRFASGNFKGHQFIERLPATERHRFEILNPYQGGDDDIWALHHLDIERKHKRLLTVTPSIASLNVSGWGIDAKPARAFTGLENETGLCYIAKGTHPTNVDLFTAITVNEPALGRRQQAWLTLQLLSKKARFVIESFK